MVLSASGTQPRAARHRCRLQGDGGKEEDSSLSNGEKHRVRRELRKQMFEKLLTLSTTEYDKASSGSIITKFSFDIEQIAGSVSTALTTFIQDTLRIVVLMSFMLWLSWQLSAIFLLIIPVISVIVVVVSKRFREVSKNIQKMMGIVTSATEQTFNGHKVVLTFGVRRASFCVLLK